MIAAMTMIAIITIVTMDVVTGRMNNMAEKLVYITPKEIKEQVMKFGWLTSFGSYNVIPQPYKKLNSVQFADIAKLGTPEYMEYRMLAIIEGDKDTYIPSVIHWYRDTGVMIMFDNDGVVDFYQLGCQHKYEEKYDKGRTDLKCKLCGYEDVEYDEPTEEKI
jgi:hypothetical protein